MRKGCAAVLLALALLVGAAVLVYRNGVHPTVVLWILQHTWERTDNLEAQVSGELELMGLPITATGRLRFKKPNLYDLDFNVVRVIAGPQDLWVVIPAIKAGARVQADNMPPGQLLERVLSGWDVSNPTRWVHEALTDPAQVRLFAPEVIENQRCWVLEWPARTGEKIGGTLYVSQRTRAPVRFDQHDSARRVVRSFTVSEFRRNPGLKAEDFQYKPMEGYRTFDLPYDPSHPPALEQLLRGGNDGTQPTAELWDHMQHHLPPAAARWLKRHGM